MLREFPRLCPGLVGTLEWGQQRQGLENMAFDHSSVLRHPREILVWGDWVKFRQIILGGLRL